jgi:glutaredoxin-like YruB-family protein
MAIKEIGSFEELQSNLTDEKKSYVLLYKKGSEASDCSYQSIEHAATEMKNINIMAADVSVVRDIHTRYNITSAPSLLVFEGRNFSKTVKGCNDDNFYKSLFESALFSARATDDTKVQKRVTVYSTPTCTWCNTLKRHLDQFGIRYKDIDVSKDQKAAEAMVKKSGQQGVPQTDINGQIIVGFDKMRINSLLGIN